VYRAFRPDLETPTRDDVIPTFIQFQGMPIPYIEPVDIANLAVFLGSDVSRYMTGQQIRIDAGASSDSRTDPCSSPSWGARRRFRQSRGAGASGSVTCGLAGVNPSSG
jgi:hypothetical protein